VVVTVGPLTVVVTVATATVAVTGGPVTITVVAGTVTVTVGAVADCVEKISVANDTVKKDRVVSVNVTATRVVIGSSVSVTEIVSAIFLLFAAAGSGSAPPIARKVPSSRIPIA